MGRADGGVGGYEVGAWLERFDAEFGGGRGWARWTRDPRKAAQYPNLAAAHAAWTTVPKCAPVRPDGKPNRPLTAFTVTIEPAR
jgi:hypothetical protein